MRSKFQDATVNGKQLKNVTISYCCSSKGKASLSPLRSVTFLVYEKVIKQRLFHLFTRWHEPFHDIAAWETFLFVLSQRRKVSDGQRSNIEGGERKFR